MIIWSGTIDEGFGKRFLIAAWLVLIALAAASNIFLAFELTFGILLGGITINLNLLWIYKDTWRLLRHKSPFIYFCGFIARLSLLAVFLGFILINFPSMFSIPGVIIGLSIAPLTLLILIFQIMLTSGEQNNINPENSSEEAEKDS